MMLVEYNQSSLTSELREWMLLLVEENVSGYYINSTIGWDRNAKRRELFEEEEVLNGMTFIIMESDDDDRSPLGFVAALDTIEGGERVIYCYELQVIKKSRGRGVGSKLMEKFHLIGKEKGIVKGMLTCFTENRPALRFYSKIGYSIDPYSPCGNESEDEDEDDYVILSRLLI